MSRLNMSSADKACLILKELQPSFAQTCRTQLLLTTIIGWIERMNGVEGDPHHLVKSGNVSWLPRTYWSCASDQQLVNLIN